MSSRYEEKRYPAEEVRKAPYQPGDIQRRQQAAQENGRRRNPVNEVRSQRYQQETLAGDWQQDWSRTPYDNRNDRQFTAGQGILILVILVLVLSLAGMTLFWYTGRSSLRNSADSGTIIQHNSDVPAENKMPDDNITILDISNEE